VGEVDFGLEDRIHEEARGPAFPLVVGTGMDMVGSHVFRTIRGFEGPLPTCERTIRVEVGVDHDAPGPGDASDLPQKASEVRDVAHHQTGHDHVKA
jgi:hypothetical protein